MLKEYNNFTYIDGANLYEAVRELGWFLDYKRFRIWLLEKYGIKQTYIFKRSILEAQKEKAPDAD
jgi:hypothetical protein